MTRDTAVPNLCAVHPWRAAAILSRYDDKTPLCTLCWDAEQLGISVKEYERCLAAGR